MVTSTPLQIDPRVKLLRLEQELNQSFFEREELIRIVLLSLLTRQHTLVFGKHGAAKSSLIRALASALSCECFTIQLGKDTPRDELFGPIRVSKLPEDQLCRAYENFMPGKPLVFLDELPRQTSSTLSFSAHPHPRWIEREGMRLDIPATGNDPSLTPRNRAF